MRRWSSQGWWGGAVIVELLCQVAWASATRGPFYQCCAGERFRMGLHETDLMPHFQWKGEGQMPTGYLPELVSLMTAEMGMHLEVVPEPLDWDSWAKIGQQGPGGLTCIPQITDQTIISRDFYNSFNLTATPVTVSRDQYGVLLRKVPVTGSMWRIFSPFSTSMWMAILGTVFYMALVMVFIETMQPRTQLAESNCATEVELYSRVVYHAFAAILSGEDYDWVNWPGRILRLGILFFVLVTTSTYTANLAAFFTKPSFLIEGPQSMEELRTSKVLVINPYDVQVGSFAKEIEPIYNYNEANWTGWWISDVPDLECVRKTIDQGTEYGPLYDLDCILQVGIEMVRTGQRPAFAAPSKALTYYSRVHRNLCNELILAEDILFGRYDMQFIFHQRDSALGRPVSLTLDWLATQPSWRQLEDRWFSGGKCSDAVSATAEISLDTQGGLFVILGGFSLLAVVAALTSRQLDQRGGESNGDEEEDLPPDLRGKTDGELLRILFTKLDRISGADVPGAAPLDGQAGVQSRVRALGMSGRNVTASATTGVPGSDSEPKANNFVYAMTEGPVVAEFSNSVAIGGH